MAYKINLFDTEIDCIGSGCMSLDYIGFQLEMANKQDIEVDISSAGGSAFDAVAIYNLLKAYGVNTNNISIAGSAASTVFAAGVKRRMSKYAVLMIHPAMTASTGDSNDLIADGAMLSKITENIIAIWVDVTGQSVEKITELVNATTWLTADEALALGFITEIVDQQEAELKNAATVTNQIQSAPPRYKAVINKILIKTPEETAQPPIKMTKEEVEAIAGKNDGLLKKVWNFIVGNQTKIVTNKGDKFIAGNLAVGSAVYNDAEMDSPSDDGDVEATNAFGKKVTLKVKNGKIDELSEEDPDADEDNDEDLEAENKVVLNSAGITFGKKVSNKALKNSLALKLKEVMNQATSSNALVAELRTQLAVSNEAVKLTEDAVKNKIMSEFVPSGSQRSATKVTNTAIPDFLKPKEGSLAANAVKKTMASQ